MAATETKASEPETGNQGVTLGIGTLAVIALIVTMCSGRSELEKVQKDAAALKQKLEMIDSKLDMLMAKDSAATSTSVEAPATPADAGVAPPREP